MVNRGFRVKTSLQLHTQARLLAQRFQAECGPTAVPNLLLVVQKWGALSRALQLYSVTHLLFPSRIAHTRVILRSEPRNCG